MPTATKGAMATVARLMATAPKRARTRAERGLAMATMVAGNKEGDGKSGKSNGDSNRKGKSRATRLMPTATKKAMAIATAAREGDGGKRDGNGD
jgi:hypothetical protein